MSNLKIKIKKLHQNAVIPKYAINGDAGLDLTAVSKSTDENSCIVYKTGIAIEIPRGYVGLIFPRSSISKVNLSLSNAVGIIDSGYNGEITFKFIKGDRNHIFTPEYNVGDRVGQLIIMPYPQIEFEEVSEISETERGSGGYGSTGK